MLKTQDNKDSRLASIILYVIFVGMLIGGIVLLLKNIGVIGGHPGWIKTDAWITKVYGAEGGIEIKYFFGDRWYENCRLSEYAITYKVGDKISILVNPNDPGYFVSASTTNSIGFWGACIFCLLIGGGGTLGLVSTKAREKSGKKELAAANNANANEDLSSIENRLLNGEAVVKETRAKVSSKARTNYSFKQVGTKTYEYQMFDSDNKLVYSCKKTKGSFMSGVTITFTDNVTNKEVNHNVGRIAPYTTSAIEHNSSRMPFYFYMDKLLVWDLFDHMKIRLESTDLMNFKIYYNNEEIATCNKIPSKKTNWTGKKRKDVEVSCVKEYLDIVFLAIFAFTYPPLNDYNVRY